MCPSICGAHADIDYRPQARAIRREHYSATRVATLIRTTNETRDA